MKVIGKDFEDLGDEDLIISHGYTLQTATNHKINCYLYS